MNYSGTNLVSSGVTLTINQKVNLLAGVNATDVVVDVDGYYTPTLWVHASGDGSVLASGGDVASTTVADPNTAAPYQVQFDRDVSNCAYAVTVGFDQNYATVSKGSSSDVVLVKVTSHSGTLFKADFYLTVDC